MLVEMKSPAFMDHGQERRLTTFHGGLNVVLGEEDGAMSIGKSSSLLAIDFAFGGDTYIKSDGVRHEGHHTVFFAFEFKGVRHYFARNTSDGDTVFFCDKDYNLTGAKYTKEEFISWLRNQYCMEYEGVSFRTVLSSFFRIYGKGNTDELNPLKGIPGQNMEKSIATILTVFNRYGDIQEFRDSVTEHSKRLEAFRDARKYQFISDLVGGQKKYEENLAAIRDLELQLATLMEEAEQGHSEEEIELNKQKAALTSEKLNTENAIHTREMKLRLLNMSLEYGLYPTEADMSALQEFFPEVNIRKLYEVEQYHQKLARILDAQFAEERTAIEREIAELRAQWEAVNAQIRALGFVGNISREFLDRHSEIKAEIAALRTQNQAYLTQTELQAAKATAVDVLKRSIEDILREIEDILNGQMKEFNDSLFTTKKKPPQVHFSAYNSYRFETPDNTGTGSNYKGMLIYDLAVLFTTALPALAHDSLLFKNLGKDAEGGIFQIYAMAASELPDRQIFIAYDKQGDCRPGTRTILEANCVMRLSKGGGELYGHPWDIEEDGNGNEL